MHTTSSQRKQKSDGFEMLSHEFSRMPVLHQANREFSVLRFCTQGARLSRNAQKLIVFCVFDGWAIKKCSETNSILLIFLCFPQSNGNPYVEWMAWDLPLSLWKNAKPTKQRNIISFGAYLDYPTKKIKIQFVYLFI